MKRVLISLAFTIVFWNAENFFDWKAEGTSSSETDFSSSGRRHWTYRRFTAKCNAIAKTVLAVSDSTGSIPDIVAFAEIENISVLKKLISYTALDKFGFKPILFESPDKRGIDCGLIYRSQRVKVVNACAKHIYDNGGVVMKTRDILLVETDSLDILVNHHPSKVGKNGEENRFLAMTRMNALCDSLERCGHGRIVCVGDFNDDVWGGGDGTIKHNGRWEKIDGFFARGITVHETVWKAAYLTTADKKFGGVKPLRTYNGMKYLGGVSDHYPIVLTF